MGYVGRLNYRTWDTAKHQIVYTEDLFFPDQEHAIPSILALRLHTYPTSVG